MKMLLCLSLLALFFFLLSCEIEEQEILKEIEYKVSPSSQDFGNVDIIAFTEDGETKFLSVSVPWSYSFEAYSNTTLSLSATLLQDYGILSVWIGIDGKEYRRGQTAVAYGIVEVSGIVRK